MRTIIGLLAAVLLVVSVGCTDPSKNAGTTPPAKTA